MAKGLVYSDIADPKLPARALRRWQRLADASRGRRTMEQIGNEVIARHNARWAIVGLCPRCGRELIAGELEPHIMSHVSARARTVARMLLELPTDALRAEVLALFAAEGAFRGQ